MNLFDENKTSGNLLPVDGEAYYHGVVLNSRERQFYFDRLLHHIEWKNDEVVLFGKKIVTKRKMAWYGEDEYAYTYSNTTRRALLLTNELNELKTLAEKITLSTYNSVLLNLYHDGREGMSWHSDNETMLKKNAPIASISLGAERRFLLRHKENKDTVSVMLENGSLLEMKGTTQQCWLHRLPVSAKVLKPRINLTFRTINV
jgi:alkylated DNA repair dioxygenase AlkB